MDMEDFFGPVIHSYTRADAIRDGALVAVDGATSREAGIRWPVALTAAAWADCVDWDDDDNDRQDTFQDQAGRLWDVLWMAAAHMRRAAATWTPSDGPLPVDLFRVRRDGRSGEPVPVRLHLVLGTESDGIAITIAMPGED